MPPFFPRKKKNKTASYLSGMLEEPSVATYLRGDTKPQPEIEDQRIGMTDEEKARDVLSDSMLPAHLQNNPWGSVDKSDLEAERNYKAMGVDRENEPSLEALNYYNAPQNKTYFGKGADEQMLYGEDGRPTVPISDEFLKNQSRKNAYKLLTGPAELFLSATAEGAKIVRRELEKDFKMGEEGFSLNPVALAGDIFYDQDENRKKFDEALANKEQELGRETTFFEEDDLFDETFPTIPYWRGTTELAVEMLVPATVVENLIGKGAGSLLKPVWKGSVKSYKAITQAGDYFKRNKVKVHDGEFTPTHRLNYGENPVPVGGGSGEIAATSLRAAPEENFFAQPDMKEGLSKKEQLVDYLAEKLHFGSKDRYVNQVFEVRHEINFRADNLSTSMANEFDAGAKRLFDIDDAGRVSGFENVDTATKTLDAVVGNPTIQDIAARLPKYWDSLSAQQRDFFVDMRDRLVPMERQLIDMDVKLISDVNKRPDIIKSKENPEISGFYLPRGNAIDTTIAGMDNPRTFMTPGFDKTSVYKSQAAGIDAGHEYDSFYSALKSYIDYSGRQYADAWVAKQFRNATDESGNLIGSTLNQRMLEKPEFVEYQNLIKKIKSEASKLRTETTKLSVKKSHSRKAIRQAQKDIEKADRKIIQIENRKARNEATDELEKELRAEKLLEKKAKAEKLIDEANPFTPEDMRFTRKQLRKAITQGRNQVIKATRLKAKLKEANIKLGKEEKAFFKEMDELTKAMDEAEAFAKANMIDDVSLGVTGNVPIFGTKTALRKYEAMLRRAERIEERAAKLNDQIEQRNLAISAKLDEMNIVTDADRANKQGIRDLINQNTYQQQIDRTIYGVEREIKRLEIEHKRLNKVKENYSNKEIKQQARTIKDAEKAGDKINKNLAATLEQVQRKRDDLAELKQAAKEGREKVNDLKRAEMARDDISAVNLKTLSGWEFPQAFAKAVNEQLQKEAKTRGKDAKWLAKFRAYNNFFRSLKATYDFSAVGVHGFGSLYDNPKEATQAFKFGLEAWADSGEVLLGNFITDFNKTTVQAGRLTTEDWARAGLRIGGQETEFILRENVLTSRIPFVKRFNKAFGYYGDKLRLESADDIISGYLASGKTIEQMRLNGDLTRIAKEVNAMTGYSDKAFGGSLGELLLFAPRFLTARVETLYKGTKGFASAPVRATAESIPIVGRSISDALPNARILGMGTGTTLENRVARRSMLRLFGHATWMTFAINGALGNETDTRLMINTPDGYRYNTNFMKVNFMGRDYSLYGPYEFLMKMLITTGTADVGAMVSAAQGLSSGAVQNSAAVFDTMVGDQTNSFGRKITGEYIKLDDWIHSEGITDKVLALTSFLIENHAPIALGESPTNINLMLPESVGGEGEFLKGLTGLFAETVGARQAPETLRDIRKRVAEEYNKQGIKSPTGGKFDYKNLSAGEKKMIDQHPDVQKYKDSMNVELQGVPLANEQRKQRIFGAEDRLVELFAENEAPDMEVLKEEIQELKAERTAANEAFQFSHGEELEKYEGTNKTHVWDSYAMRYYDRDLEEHIPTGFQDWDKFDEEGQAILTEAFKAEGQELVDYITLPSSSSDFNFKSSQYQNPQVKKIVEEYDSHQKTLKPYYKLPLATAVQYADQLPNIVNLYNEHIRKSPSDQQEMLQVAKNFAAGIKLTTTEMELLEDSQKLNHLINFLIPKEQDLYRENNWLADAYLYMWDGTEPKSLVVQKMKSELVAESIQREDIENPRRWDLRDKIAELTKTNP